MNKKPKSKRRIIVCAVAVLAVAAIYLARGEESSTDKLADLSAQLTKWHQLEQHDQIIERVAPQISVIQESPELLKIYGLAQLQRPLPNNRHIIIASQMFRQARKFAPADQQLTRYLFELDMRTGDWSQAIIDGKRALELASSDYQLHLDVAKAMQNGRASAEAAAIVERAIEMQPTLLPGYEQRIAIDIADTKSLEEIDETIVQLAAIPSALPAEKIRLLLMADKNTTTRDALESLVDDELVAQDANRTWLVDKLESAGEFDKAIALLAASAGNEDSDSKIAFRLWQRGDYVPLIERLDTVSNPAAQLLVLKTLAQAFHGEFEAAQSTLEDLSTDQTQLAVRWHAVLSAMLTQPTTAEKFVAACNDAIAVYPQNAYLLHLLALGYDELGERNLAIESVRRAITLAPRWASPRIVLADWQHSAGMEQSAIAEAVIALQINPQLSQPFDTLVKATTRYVSTGNKLSSEEKQPLASTLQVLQDNAQSESSRLLYQATIDFLNQRLEKSDKAIQEILQDRELSVAELGRLKYLSRNEKTTLAIATRLASITGLNMDELVDATVKAAGAVVSSGTTVSNGTATTAIQEQKGCQFLQNYRISGEPLTPNKMQLAKARFFSQIQSPNAKDAWLDLANQATENAEILRVVLSRPELQDASEERMRITNNLLANSPPESVHARFAKAQISFNSDKSEKNCAAVILQLTDIVKDAPNFAPAYALMAESYDHVGQPERALSVLQTGAKNKLIPPVLQLNIAHRLIQFDRVAEATAAVSSLADSTHATPQQLQSAVAILVDADLYQDAADIVTRLLPAEFKPNDKDFALARLHGFVETNLGNIENVLPRIQALAEKEDRWFELWITLALQPDKVRAKTAEEMLGSAEQWTKKASRRRKLSSAWRQLAKRHNEKRYWHRALKLVQQIPRHEISTGDFLAMASIFTALDEHQKATSAYRIALKQIDNDDTLLTALTLNNLALLNFDDETKISASEELARKAVNIHSRPEFSDTLAMILAKQEVTSEAVEILNESISQFPEAAVTRLRLASLFIEQGQLDEARQTVDAIKQLGNRVDLSADEWQNLRELEHALNAAEEMPTTT